MFAVLVGVGGIAVGAPAAAAPNGVTMTTTTSTTTSRHYTRVDLPNVEVATTRVAVVRDGVIVFDQTVSDGPASGSAGLLLDQAAGALAGACAVAGPFTSSSDEVGPAVHVGDVLPPLPAIGNPAQSISTQTTFGPATILIGPEQSQTFFVPAGATNVNTNTHSAYFVDQQYQATVTHATDLVFTAQSCGAAQTVPDPPTGVTAMLGSIVVSWTPPANTGTSPITSYVVTESPGGQTYTVDGSTTTLRIEDPAPGMYTFTVRAINASGSSVESAPSNPVTVAAVGAAATPVVATPRTAG